MEMYYGIRLDEEGYFKRKTESSSKKTAEMNGILVESLPDVDEKYYPAYKYENEEWILDEEKLKIIQEKLIKQKVIEKKNFEIEELKKKLSDADYNAIKCLEQIIKYLAPILHFDWYKDIGNNREAWREQINKLEEEIKDIEEGGSN